MNANITAPASDQPAAGDAPLDNLPPPWLKATSANPLPWLLAPDNPSVRYQALVHLLHLPTSDQRVQETRQAIGDLPLVRELLASQHPAGHWGDDPARPYRAAGTLGVLQLLFTLQVTPDGRTTAGCDSFLRFSQHETGGISLAGRQRSGITPCTTGEHLPMLVYFGLGDDPRVGRAFQFLVETMAEDDPLRCGRYGHQPCLWGAIAALKGLAVFPAALRSPGWQRAVQRLADALLDAPYDFAGEHKTWLSFRVPRQWDLLSALRCLADLDYATDPRFEPLLALLLAQQDRDGRWRCGAVSRTWPLEKRNQPSKWVTLDALRVLKSSQPNV